ncbi:ketopantoate reductase family protein [Bacillus sp. 1NLA3E]|uniref:ketopantoate reductase family protein n=1 Tax=Bacillus sp. 1NLA3E TaxID=666686 RepID=UPI000247E7D3|nr:ketopantoate reductase family protein [Bacillus sp. 1NLA3E]AGK52197.1 2-dehydropantoate 2-reductase [Bacillus sp. 1NLA3E]
MRILVVGAGAIGGYFGGRLMEKGEDVTFLVRAKRKQQLEETGLIVESVNGNINLQVKTVDARDDAGHFDVIFLSTKAYHLQGAIDNIRPFVGDETMIVPLLNGINHIEKLIEEFGSEKVLGGLCFIETTLNSNGKVIQTSPAHDLMFGERNGEVTERVRKLEKTLSGTKANIRLSHTIIQDMWHKYMFITAVSGITTLMRAPIGPIRDETGGQKTISNLLNEITKIMLKIKAPIAESIEAIQLEKMNGLGYSMKSSMQRDMEKKMPIEADHLQGYLLKLAKEYEIQVPVLEVVYANLKIYESQLGQE